jgi:hypothetical protein
MSGQHARDALNSLMGGDDEGDFGYFSDRPAARPVCRSCGEECTWHHTGVRWGLMGDNGRLHTCDVSDDFEVIS